MLSKQTAEICSIIKTAHPGNFTDWQTELVFLSQQAFGVLNSYIRQVLVWRHACKLMKLPADMVFTVAGCSQRLCNVKIRVAVGYRDRVDQLSDHTVGSSVSRPFLNQLECDAVKRLGYFIGSLMQQIPFQQYRQDLLHRVADIVRKRNRFLRRKSVFC